MSWFCVLGFASADVRRATGCSCRSAVCFESGRKGSSWSCYTTWIHTAHCHSSTAENRAQESWSGNTHCMQTHTYLLYIYINILLLILSQSPDFELPDVMWPSLSAGFWEDSGGRSIGDVPELWDQGETLQNCFKCSKHSTNRHPVQKNTSQISDQLAFSGQNIPQILGANSLVGSMPT